MLGEPHFYVLGDADVEIPFGILNHVDAIHFKEVVAGAGFEPAIPRLRDYEPDGRARPVIL